MTRKILTRFVNGTVSLLVVISLSACATASEPLVVAPVAETESAPAVECKTGAEVIADIVNALPEAKVAAQWHGRQARNLIAGYNAIPPVTTFEVDRIVMIVHPLYRTVIVMGFLDDCLQLFDTQYPRNIVAQLDIWANDGDI